MLEAQIEQQIQDQEGVDNATRMRSLFGVCLGGCTLFICFCCVFSIASAILAADEVVFFPSEDDTETVSEVILVNPEASGAAVVQIDTQGDLLLSTATNVERGTLLSGEFRFNVDGYRPVFNDNLNGGQQVVRIERKADQVLVIGTAINEWNVAFAQGVAFELETTTGSGDITATFDALDIQTLEFGTDSGAIDVSLAGQFANLNSITLRTDSGDITLDATDRTAFPRLTAINVSADSGDTDIDLRTDWNTDTRLDLENDSGNITLLLPQGVSLDISADTSSGTVRLFGENEGENARLRNTVEGAPTLTIRVDAESGDIRIER